MFYRIIAIFIILIVTSLTNSEIDLSDFDDSFDLPNVLSAENEQEIVFVSRVIDGDTVELTSGEKVRYIGIDSPETRGKEKECFANEAYEYNKALVEGKFVRLEKDVSEKDKYGRLLRYVYIETEDGSIFINRKLVEEGYAYSKSYYPDTNFDLDFESAEKQAKSINIGMWGYCEY